MASKTRIANKTQWALMDVLAELAEAKRATKEMQKRNEQKLLDPLVAMYLCRLADALGRIEVTVVRAQHGEYGNGTVDKKAE